MATRVTRFGLVNCYLIEEEDGLTLVDTMLPRSDKVILEAGKRLGREIRRIALTHAHQDHHGSLDALAAALPDAEVLISARDARLLAGEKKLDPAEDLRGAKLRGAYTSAKTKPTRTVGAGDRIGSLEVIEAPGHTPGHVAYMDTRDRTLYCGDAYSTLGGVATAAKMNPRFPLVYMATWHRPTALVTARALRTLDPAALAPGHGKVIDNPGPAMDRAIAKAS
jgi:glyoxylase-like metal-dependent hydrolase (beta-lactamase superfamily II)